MLLLDQHPRFPPGSDERRVVVAGLDEDVVATAAHVIADHIVFVAVEGDAFRVGHVDSPGRSMLCREPAAGPTLATACTGYAYVTSSGDIRIVDLSTGRCSALAGPASAVVLSADLRWAAVRNSEGVEIRAVDTGRIHRRFKGVVLSVSPGGQPTLTLDEAAAELRASTDVEGPFTLSGAVDLGGVTLAFFNHLSGTALVSKSPDDVSCNVSWDLGRWVAGVSRLNDSVFVGLQRLDRLDTITLDSAPSQRKLENRSELSKDAQFEIDWVPSSGDVRVPLSRFRAPQRKPKRSLVTVHGGFGLSLRPLSGMNWSGDGVDVVYAHVRGGGELGRAWAQSGRGNLKRNGLDDLCSVLRHEAVEGRIPSLIGTSHGGWLALLASLTNPALVDRVCVTSPITHLRTYLASPLGMKHRSEFPADELDAFDPIATIGKLTCDNLPRLMIVCGAADTIVSDQNPDAFAARWRAAGGSCQIVWHSGGHYSPRAGEVSRIKREQELFLGIGQ